MYIIIKKIYFDSPDTSTQFTENKQKKKKPLICIFLNKLICKMSQNYFLRETSTDKIDVENVTEVST